MVFSKFSGSIKFGFFSGGGFPSLCFSKIGSCFWFKKFRVKFAQVSKIGFVVFAQVLASKRFHFAKSVFVACVSLGKVRFVKLASRFFVKVWVSLVRAFLPGSFFLAK